MKKEKKRRHLKKEVIWMLHGLFFVVIGIVTVKRAFAAPPTAEYVIECGAPLPAPEVFFTHDAQDVSYATREEIADYLAKSGQDVPETIDTAVLGAHRVYLNRDGKIYTALLLVQDTEPPVIEVEAEQTVLPGETVSYKRGVTVRDNHDKNVTLTVDASAVDLNTPGNYIVTYHATDMAGNEASVNAMLHVLSPVVEREPEEILSEEEQELYAYADDVLAEITTDDMSLYEKARAIYNWTHEIEYIHIYDEDRSDTENAMRGLTERTGDCHVYEATARVLLQRTGIDTITVVNEEPAVAHAWNLINLGEGWRHFDATKRYQEADLFYLTDEELMEYSSSHDYTHLYDRTKYPAAE